jgi:hypothetical protein
MSVNASEFNLGLDGWKKLTRTQSVLAQRKVTLQILRGVIRANPVDTGRMRSAWQATVGEASTSTAFRALSDNEKERDGDSAASAFSHHSAGNSLATLTFGQATFVVNNVQYAGYVNDLHPTKAHFVEAVLSNVSSQFGGGS